MRTRFIIVAALVAACGSKEAPSSGSASGSSSAAPAETPAPTPRPSHAKAGPTGQAPAWVPLYPGATPPAGFMKMGNGVGFNQETTDAADAIFVFYEKALADAGFTVEVIKTPNTPKVPGMINASSAEPPRKLSVTVSQTGDSGKAGITKLLFATDGE